MEIVATQEELQREEARDWATQLPSWATWTAQEAVDYIETEVVDLSTAKIVIKALAKAICYLRDYTEICN